MVYKVFDVETGEEVAEFDNLEDAVQAVDEKDEDRLYFQTISEDQDSLVYTWLMSVLSWVSKFGATYAS